jgi:hypothetical protein
VGENIMPIYSLLREGSFDPEHIQIIAAAFEDVCRDLGLAPREDPLRDIVARAIIDCAKKGEHDPIRLRACAHDAIKTPH